MGSVQELTSLFEAAGVQSSDLNELVLETADTLFKNTNENGREAQEAFVAEAGLQVMKGDDLAEQIHRVVYAQAKAANDKGLAAQVEYARKVNSPTIIRWFLRKTAMETLVEAITQRQMDRIRGGDIELAADWLRDGTPGLKNMKPFEVAGVAKELELADDRSDCARAMKMIEVLELTGGSNVTNDQVMPDAKEDALISPGNAHPAEPQ